MNSQVNINPRYINYCTVLPNKNSHASIQYINLNLCLQEECPLQCKPENTTHLKCRIQQTPTSSVKCSKRPFAEPVQSELNIRIHTMLYYACKGTPASQLLSSCQHSSSVKKNEEEKRHACTGLPKQSTLVLCFC